MRKQEKMKRIMYKPDFEAIKANIRANGGNLHMTAHELGWGKTTVGRVNGMKSWEDMLAYRRKRTASDVRKQGKQSSKHYSLLTEKDYDQIKALLDLGLTQTQVEGVTKRANSTINLIARSDSFTGYQALRDNYKRKAIEVKAPIEPVTEAPADVNLPALEVKVLDEIVKVLNSLNDEIHRLASTNAKLEERVLYVEDYTKTIAEGLTERRGLFNR